MSSERTLTVARAGREAVMWEMQNDPSVFMLGEDVFAFGGVFGTGISARQGIVQDLNRNSMLGTLSHILKNDSGSVHWPSSN